MYYNSNDTKAVFVGVSLSASSQPAFRYFPGNDLSAVNKSLFACEGEFGECFDPTTRDWYTLAESSDVNHETGLGDVVITKPYIDAIGSENDWLVTIARAVYGDTGSTAGPLLGVVGVDVRLEQVQQSVEAINFLASGYSILASAESGSVLAVPALVWDKTKAENYTTVCKLDNGMCSTDSTDDWKHLLSATNNSVYKFTTPSSNGEDEDAILIAAPVSTVFDIETGAGTTTHYILSAVRSEEIFEPVKGMTDLIKSSTTEIIATTGLVAAATLVAVAVAVYFLSGNITRPIVKMTSAARSIAKDGAKTDVFGGVSAAWGGGRDGGSSMDGMAAGAGSRGTRAIDYLLCRGEDEISTLAREFALMITGLGKRGSAARATGLEDNSVYPKNPFTTEFVREPPTAPSAPRGS